MWRVWTTSMFMCSTQSRMVSTSGWGPNSLNTTTTPLPTLPLATTRQLLVGTLNLF